MLDWRRSGRCSVAVGLLAVMAVSLAGCGRDAANRMGGGTAGGAATGATFGLIGGPIGVLVGGAIGGGIGALTAANTTPKQIDLGNPPWAGRNSGPATPASQRAAPLGQSDQYGAQQGQSSSNGYGRPQQLMPASGSSGNGYGTAGRGNYGDNVQSAPLAPPSTQ